MREVATDDEDSDFSPGAGGGGPARRQHELRPRVRRRTKSSGDSRKPHHGRRRPEQAAQRPQTAARLRQLAFVAVGLGCGLIHALHVSTLFENDRHFSHLSTLEREMSFRTEMGMYYSYFKTVAEAPDFLSGLQLLLEDRLVEAPTTVNALQRFNLYPEVIAGGAFHWYRQQARRLGLETRECWKVDRGETLPPVWSCTGLGTPVFFYLAGVWLCSALVGVILFVYGCQLSGNIWGGVLTFVCFMSNHGESTRVMWTPPLRESFAFPFLLAQLVYVCRALTAKRPHWTQVISIGTLTALSLLFWQFSQFVLLTQCWIVYLLWVLGALSTPQLKAILAAQLLGLATAFLLLFGNRMLACSLFSDAVVAMLLVVMTLDSLLAFLPPVAGALARVGLGIVGMLGIRIELQNLLGVSDDSHIWNILRSKLSSYRDFDTMLYTCAPEFDLLPREYLSHVSSTLLLPSAIVAVALCVGGWLGGRSGLSADAKDPSGKRGSNSATVASSSDEDGAGAAVPAAAGAGGAAGAARARPPRRRRLQSGGGRDGAGDWVVFGWLAAARGRVRQDLDVLYTLLQLAVFALMAALIMRLKLFLTPMLCVCTALLASRKFVGFIRLERAHLAILAMLVSGMAVRGIRNIREQHNIVGEYENAEQEELLEWVRADTSETDVFAGPMALMANVMLSTRRPVVNHPHYESAAARLRTRQVYELFSRKTSHNAYNTLKNLGVDYVLLHEPMCYRKSKTGCAMTDLWDVEEPSLRHRPPLCRRLFEGDPSPFLRVFENSQYVVLRVPAKYVEIPPPKQMSS